MKIKVGTSIAVFSIQYINIDNLVEASALRIAYLLSSELNLNELNIPITLFPILKKFLKIKNGNQEKNAPPSPQQLAVVLPNNLMIL